MPSGESSPILKVLVDINVFEDVFRRRRGWRSSERVIYSIRKRKAIGYVSALTIPILWYFRSQHHSDAEARRLTNAILHGFHVVALTNRVLRAALASSMTDFEDAVQYESAHAVKVDYTVTRNIAHFTLPSIPAVTPEEFLHSV